MVKKKTYVLMISRVFPKTHPRSGQLTYFKEQILHGQNQDAGIFLTTQRRSTNSTLTNGKIHTIRSSYDLWAKRAEKINAGEAVLSLRQWSGDPYKSKQVEFMQLTKIGVKHVKIENWQWNGQRVVAVTVNDVIQNIDVVAKNDGLSVDDFCKWFKFKDDFEGCLIHFTEFRYIYEHWNNKTHRHHPENY